MTKPLAADYARHTAAVCRTEAEVRRPRDPDFATVLDTWAANADRRADEAARDDQPDLFSLQHKDRAA